MAKKTAKKSPKKAPKKAPKKKAAPKAKAKVVAKLVKPVRKAAPKAKAKAAPAKVAKPQAPKPAAPPPLPPGQAPGMPAIAPYLCVKDVLGALAYYTKAFGFKERFRMPGPGGAVVHAEMQHQGGVIMMGPENLEGGAAAPAAGGCVPVSMYVYVPDVDALHTRAIAAGGKSQMAPTDMFWGDRACKLVDPEGHSWMFATFKKVVSPEEIAAAMAQPPPGQAGT